MLSSIPIALSLLFGTTTLLTLFLFVHTIRKSVDESTRKISVPILIGIVVWLALQSFFSITNYYSSDTTSLPPKIAVFGIIPLFLVILLLYIFSSGRRFMDSLPLKYLTLIHVVRIPVELVLYFLFVYKTVPELMTFEGRNFDILAGLTAPIIYYFGYVKQQLNRTILIIWNLISLGLLLNIVFNALLSAPSPIQQFAFDQPNTAILYFPFSLLPTFIVPVVLFSHLVTLRHLFKKQ
jgi:hypothetical protein